MDLIEGGLKNPIRHWYYSHKYWFISSSSHFRKGSDNLLVDIGAGSALFSKELLRTNRVRRSIAVDTGYPEDFDDPDLNLSYRQKIDFAGHTHFLLTDVLEHVQDDRTFLREIASHADKHSVFIITVPAHMNLWSGHDVYLKHYRRYTKNGLQALVKSAGLTVRKSRYTYSTLFPIALFQRKFFGSKSVNSQMKDNGFVVSSILRFLLFPDRWISILPFGVSLYLEASKDD